MTEPAAPKTPPQPQARPRARHSLLVRLTHGLNVLVLLVLLGSGLQIFNAHPALYWGHASTFADPWISMTAEPRGEGRAGVTQMGGLTLETTGVLGLSDGKAQGFPAWATLPGYRSLAEGRRWHFFFAWLFVFNGVAYLAWGLFSGHFRRDLALQRRDLAPRHLWAEIKAHLALRFPHGRYNALQKIVYLGVIFGLLPLMVISGLGMSPGVNAAWPWTFEMFGGRQSARTIHFLCALALIAFVLIHIAMVIASGPVRQMRAMITGGQTLPPTPGAPS